MDDDFDNLETLLAAAVEIQDAAEREAYLLQCCDGDAGMLAELHSMVRDYYAAGSWIDRPVTMLISSPLQQTLAIGQRVGPYKLRELLGEGGMGSVYVAEQEQPVRRKVALKIIKPGMDSREVICRFEAERQALALMDHQHIAKVLDAGTADNGRPYFAMELVKGTPITEHCNAHKLAIRERLRLFLQVCQAVQHAHQKGIIHRDLKPPNVIVAMHDTTPVVKVIDFGVAKAIGQQLTEHTLYTGFSQLIGTPLYMSPEQARRSSLDIDTRSDVYSLGVLLYELLTGSTPFESDELKKVDYDELRRIIREVEPLRPSARVSTLSAAELSTVAELHQVEPRKFREQLRGELDWIVVRAIEKDRKRRYQSAADLAADIERYLSDEPVEACPPSTFYRLAKLTRRNKVLLSTIGLVAVALLAGTAVSLWQAIEANAARRLADQRLELADQRLENETQARNEILQRESDLRRELYATDMALAGRAWENGDLSHCRGLLDRHRPQAAHDDLREFAWHYLMACCQPAEKTLFGHEAPILTCDLSKDDQLIASGDRAGTIKLWELNSGRELRSWKYDDLEVTSVRFSPDGTHLATAGQDRSIRLWNVSTWTEAASLRGHEGTVTCIDWSPDSRWIASSGRDNCVKIWDMATGLQAQSLPHADVSRCLIWSPDGRLLASADGGQVQLWEAGTWRSLGILDGPEGGVLALSFSPDGEWVACGGYGDLFVHDVARQSQVARIVTNKGAVWSVAFSPDGWCLLAGLGSDGLDVWQVSHSEARVSFLRSAMRPHSTTRGDGTIRAMLFANQGETLVTGIEEAQSIEVWPTREVLGRSSLQFRNRDEGCVAFLHDRGLAVTQSPNRRVFLRSVPKLTIEATLHGHVRELWTAQYSPQQNLLATNALDGKTLLWDSVTWELRHPLASTAPSYAALAFSPDGTLLAGGGDGGGIEVWDVATAAVKLSLDLPEPRDVAFSPDGKVLAVGGEKNISLWEISSRTRLALLQVQHGIGGLAFSPDGKLLAVAGDSHVALWDVASRREVASMIGHRGGVADVAFSPDGRTLASMGSDQTIRLWHVPTRRELFTLLRWHQPLRWLQFASPSQLLVGTHGDSADPVTVFTFDGEQR